jgi:hypothetical protein
LKQLGLIFSIMLLLSYASAQELNCVVQVNYDQIQGTETRIYQTLEKAIYNFMNNTRWTADKFKIEERIECSVFITLNERNSNQFSGTIQISSRRPVYNTSYYSPIINHLDEDFYFNYVEFTPLEFNINSHLSNLTSVLAFYAYVIIGFDYNTYSKGGGDQYMEKAFRIVNNAQSEQTEGWKAYESDRNRYYIAQSMVDDFNAPLVNCMYDYHRNGLDLMQSNLDGGRKNITTALNGLDKIHASRPSSFIMKFFFNAKADEVVNLYKEALPPEQNQISTLLTKIDPGNAQKYDKILKE